MVRKIDTGRLLDVTTLITRVVEMIARGNAKMIGIDHGTTASTTTVGLMAAGWTTMALVVRTTLLSSTRAVAL
jgi:adenylosuccinate lyase